VDSLIDYLRPKLPRGFALDSYLDAGAQGHVFSGEVSGEKAAIKVYNPGTDQRRVARELGFLTSVEHPHVVRIIRADTILIEGVACPIVAYELLSGGDLTAMLEPGAPVVDADTIIRLGYEVASAVECLWSHRIVHRDIKPGNILRSQDGRFVLADIGIARHLDLSTLTLPGRAAGTPGYMSPEQALGRKFLTIHSDICSLGITLYEVAAKRHPFGRMQQNVGRRSPGPLTRYRQDLPAALSSLVHEMMRPRPRNRPSSVADRFRHLMGG